MSVRPAKTQISLGIRPVWSESSLCAQWVAKDPSFLHADSEDSDQTGRMPRLIWVFAGRTAILLVLSCGGSNLGAFLSHLSISNASPRAQRHFYCDVCLNLSVRLHCITDIATCTMRHGTWYEPHHASWQNQQNDLCAQRRLTSAWPSTKSDQSHRSKDSQWPTAFSCGQRKLYSDWADARADLRWAHMGFCWFCRAAANWLHASYRHKKHPMREVSPYGR